jgi:integrase
VDRLTKTRIDKIQPDPNREFFVWCTNPRRFGVRVSPTGRKTFVVQYARHGRTRRFAIGTFGALTVEQARSRAKELLAEIAVGGDPSRERKAGRSAPTVAELCERYLEEHARVHKRPSSIHGDEHNIKMHIKPALGSYQVQELTRQDIASFHNGMQKTPIGANRCLSLLAKMLACAQLWGIIEHNPARGIRKYRENRRDRFLSETEFARLGTTLREMEAEGKEDFYILAAVRLLAYSGLRLGEVLGLEWRDVDLERGRLRLREAKTGTRVAIINAPMHEVLTNLVARRDAAIARAEAKGKRAREDSPFVIPGRINGRPVIGIHHVWGRIRTRTELTDVKLHDLRHSFASTGAANGLSLVMIGGLLGHRSPQTTSRYIDWADAPLRGASDQVAGRIASAMAPAQPLPDNVRPMRR